ncbi:hypothetical protein [Mycobacterium colombiense]|uniref:hypothetical protein n=1 Tax=Mycobacterium colombiense TaxID=339268 RepID=UPI001401CC24|nr:hypothetical protein [Mycobacterium colombiense]
MSIGVILTIIFMVLKLTHFIAWAWWQVLIPLFIEVGFDILLFTGGLALVLKVLKD